jgi:adenylate cyclase
MRHPLTFLYRKLGPHYPTTFITLELQTAFIVAAGAVALFSSYYEVSGSEFLTVLVITEGLTAIAIGFVLARTYKRMRPLQEWIGGARSPGQTARAWRVAVELPRELVQRDFYSPIIVTLVACLTAVIVLELSWLAFFPIIFAGLLAIAYSGTLHFLALELAMRPILFDINAALETPVRIDRPSFPLRLKLLGSLPLINVITGVVVAALTSEGGGSEALGVNVLIALAVSFLISFEITVLLARSILRPVEDLEAATERIRQGRFDEHVPVTTSDEFGELSSAFNQMVDGLNERERLREAFGTYLDEEVASHIISEDYDPEGAEVEVSLVFCDVQAFTTAAAGSSAPEIVARLNELFECVVPIVARHRGHIDQFIGDGVLAVFGTPNRMSDHADRAVQCAVELARTVNSRRPGGFEVGIGVNTGQVVAGSIGGAGRFSFSVIGDAVNLCSRVEAATRDTGDPVLITANTRAQLSETIEVQERGKLEIRGYDRRVELYAPLVPDAVLSGDGGADVADPVGSPSPGLGDAPVPGDGLGRRSRPGPGVGRGDRGGRGLGRTHTLPGG